MLDLPGVAGGGTSIQSNAEQERPYLAASSGMDRAYKVGRLNVVAGHNFHPRSGQIFSP